MYSIEERIPGYYSGYGPDFLIIPYLADSGTGFDLVGDENVANPGDDIQHIGGTFQKVRNSKNIVRQLICSLGRAYSNESYLVYRYKSVIIPKVTIWKEAFER